MRKTATTVEAKMDEDINEAILRLKQFKRNYRQRYTDTSFSIER